MEDKENYQTENQIDTIFKLKQKLVSKEITDIASLKVLDFNGRVIQEAATPNKVLETNDKFFVANSGIVPFDDPKYWSFKTEDKILTATRSLGGARLVIQFNL